ncbi:MAG TPA: hypothetical protein VNZ03_06885 [Terriglobales bacterium]|nr:hypothetical protein [Terriglobales bacterium]
MADGTEPVGGEYGKEVAKTPVDEFMLAEYETIASAHFDLHNGLRQNFRFYLGLAAVPFTVLAAFKDMKVEIFDLPTVLLFLFGVVPFLGLLMFLSMINTRFDIILYTRTVNAVRAYFEMRAARLGQKDFRKYLKLPTDKFKPPYFEGFLRAYTWLFAMISFTNAAYALILFKNLQNKKLLSCLGPWWLATLFFGLHLFLYWLFSEIRKRKEIPGVENEV